MTHIQHAGKPQYWAARDGEKLVTGVLGPTEAMLHHYSGVVVETSETAYVAALPVEELEPLPDSGWLEAGHVYQHNGVALMVRQSHNRTHHDPADVPALFIVHREDAASVIEWISGEQVYAGTKRTYEGRTYECRTAHVTQSDWTPPVATTLWKLLQDVEEPQPWMQPTGSQDAYAKGDRVTYGGFVWESTIDANVWAPGVYGWTQIEPL